MRNSTLSFLITLLILGCSTKKENPVISKTNTRSPRLIQSDSLGAFSIRALEFVSDSELIFGASGGYFGSSEDTGRSFRVDSITYPSNKGIRSVAAIQGSALLATIESPGLILRMNSDGLDTVFTELDSAAFFDSMTSADDGTCYLMGDAIDGLMYLLISKDQGNSWKRITHPKLELLPGEAAFAASNSCISLIGNTIRIATGGAHSRLFTSSNEGLSWSISELPFPLTGPMCGAFSLWFLNDSTGFVAGGDWENQERCDSTLFKTVDGGQTWKEIGKNVGYVSAVRTPLGAPYPVIALSYRASYIQLNESSEFIPFSNPGAITGRFSPDSKHLAVAGRNGFFELYSLEH